MLRSCQAWRRQPSIGLVGIVVLVVIISLIQKSMLLSNQYKIIGIEGIRTPQGINLIVSNYCILPMKTIPNMFYLDRLDATLINISI